MSTLRAATIEAEDRDDILEYVSLTEHRLSVINVKYDDPEEHSYLVAIEDGEPVGCNCPGFLHHGGCYHYENAGAAIEEISE